MAISRVEAKVGSDDKISQFLHELGALGFEGEIDERYATRTVLATDNSIYVRLPRAALFPRHATDVQHIASLLGSAAFSSVSVAPRGGGTGTNGQSLTDGIVVDLSRHMHHILHIDPASRIVRVEAGVVKDQLNAALREHGLFFAPELSTSNRATIGGMISTDASGQGSCTYGKTRDHVLALDAVLLGGERLSSAPTSDEPLTDLCARKDRIGEVYRIARDICENESELIRDWFPPLNRCLTGYDLAHLRDASGRFDLNSLLCGSEGTLGFIVEATLNVLPVPKHAMLVKIRYAMFMDALKDAPALMKLKPLSIETVDSTVLTLARADMVWQSVAAFFPELPDVDSEQSGINLVEFSGDDPTEVRARVAAFVEHLGAGTSVRRLGHTIAEGEAEVGMVYAMRKRAVGLLGNVEGESRPQPFVEDTAVPPENLADYIAEFRSLLDGFGLRYGMFGHVDAGVLHVRPALNMRAPQDRALIRTVSDAVAALTIKYGGLLWGEHGKGVRSEYVPQYFGPLYPSLQRIKAAFDPRNQLNPGKIATPAQSHAQLLKIDTIMMRGELDRRIDERVWQNNSDAVHCNGNGACYNFDPDDSMCPSWKATRERVHSPKGRASLMREWLRLQSEAGADLLAPAMPVAFYSRARNSLAAALGEQDFSHQVYDAMAGCLACKSCTGQCPVKVNVPEFRSRFLSLYHMRYLRPIRDHLIASLEFTVPRVASLPGGAAIYNALTSSRLARFVLREAVGIVDSPMLSRTPWSNTQHGCKLEFATPQRLASLTKTEREHSVIFVQDAFTRFFETPVANAFLELAARLDYRVFVAPFVPSGKPLHVQGFLDRFRRIAERNSTKLLALSESGIPLVGLDPAMTLVYRQEYRKMLGSKSVPDVLLPQEWLVTALQTKRPSIVVAKKFRLLPHCTERTNAPAATASWRAVFDAAGLELTIPASGCCGMSGTYGHEARNHETSKTIFAQSWRKHVEACGALAEAEQSEREELLATGYSCRSQVKRLSGQELRHPVAVLLEVYRSARA
jgi:FAD/FMN-containing dehydrogenase/Fe-S oxidoreductase